MKKYTDINAATIDKWVEEGWKWGIPIDHETYVNAQNGNWSVVLTPTKPMPKTWLPKHLKGLKILGLAAGGGQQMPIFAALGANCTVLDYSTAQLKSEKIVSEREGYPIELIQFDMTNTLPFENETFDIIFHPVSNVYIKDVKSLFKECYRILKKNGILVSGLDNGINFMSSDEITIDQSFPFDPLLNESQMILLQSDNSGVQFSHTLEEQIGGQLEAGFIMTDIYEDLNGEGRLHELNIPTFFSTRSIKI